MYDKEDEKKERVEEQKRIQIEKEKQREIERKRHVRPWDKAKNFTTQHSSDDESDSNNKRDWEPRREYQPMSQEQWNQKQRIERKQEFAPNYDTFVKSKDNNDVIIEQCYDDRDGSLILENERIEKSLFFTTKTKTFKRRNADVSEEMMEGNDVIPSEASCSKSFRSSEQPPPKTIESSIAAGLKFLRKQSDKDVLPKNKNKWCSTNEYN